MTILADIAQKIRSKNAGPFWITIDIFCSTKESYARIEQSLSNEQVAHILGIPKEQIQRYDLPDLNVIKFSLPRPIVQGTRYDRDMHGASFANLIAEAEILDEASTS